MRSPFSLERISLQNGVGVPDGEMDLLDLGFKTLWERGEYACMSSIESTVPWRRQGWSGAWKVREGAFVGKVGALGWEKLVDIKDNWLVGGGLCDAGRKATECQINGSVRQRSGFHFFLLQQCNISRAQNLYVHMYVLVCTMSYYESHMTSKKKNNVIKRESLILSCM